MLWGGTSGDVARFAKRTGEGFSEKRDRKSYIGM